MPPNRRSLRRKASDLGSALAGTAGSLAGTVADKGRGAIEVVRGDSAEFDRVPESATPTTADEFDARERVDQEEARLERARAEALQEARREARQEFQDEFKERLRKREKRQEIDRLRRERGPDPRERLVQARQEGRRKAQLEFVEEAEETVRKEAKQQELERLRARGAQQAAQGPQMGGALSGQATAATQAIFTGGGMGGAFGVPNGQTEQASGQQPARQQQQQPQPQVASGQQQPQMAPQNMFSFGFPEGGGSFSFGIDGDVNNDGDGDRPNPLW